MTVNSLYLDFIRYTISGKCGDIDSATSIDWSDFLLFCNRQGIIGLVFNWVQRADVRFDTSILVKWIGYQKVIIRRNAIVNNRLKETVEFFNKRGLQSCILKGQANGLMYTKPELRSPGDIDIWVEGEKDDIIKMVLSVCPKAHYSIHHIKFPLFKDVSVEVHYRPIYLTNWFKDKQLQRYIRVIEKRQFENKIKFGDSEIGCLTDDFNLVYQMLHMYHHFFETRNNFKQFIDFFLLMQQSNIEAFKDDVKAHYVQLGVSRYASGIMWIMLDVLGLDGSKLLLTPNEKEGKLILRESFYYGTFSKNNLKSVIELAFANMRIITHYPKEVLLSPLFLLWHQWWRLKTYLYV